MREIEELKEYIKNNLPSAEIYEILSLDGKKIFEQSYDGKCCSLSNIAKKEGLTILFSNY